MPRNVAIRSGMPLEPRPVYGKRMLPASCMAIRLLSSTTLIGVAHDALTPVRDAFARGSGMVRHLKRTEVA